MTQLLYPGSDELEINPETPPGSRPLQRPEPLVKADAVQYLLWDVADIERQEAFLLDFGMLTAEKQAGHLYMKGYGDAPYLYYGRKAQKSAFIGIGFSVNSRAELVLLAEATGVAIEALQRPGGGEVVRLVDPNGVVIEVSCGIARAEPVPTRREPLVANTPEHKARINAGQRPPLQPSPVVRAGHCVMGANNFDETTQWYMRHLGLIPSDVMCLDDASPAIAFMRLDRGDQPADHHTVVIAKGAANGYQHSAYEVLDLDALAQGQQYLKMKRRRHVWGLGRHILGSQIFDYWDDPDGFEFEHYADGDVFTADHPTDYHPLDAGNIYAWGEDMPKNYAGPTLRQLRDMLVDLLRGRLTLGWIKLAARAVSRPSRPWL